MDWRLISFITMLCVSPLPGVAQEAEIFALGDGSSLTVDEYQVEQAGNGDISIVVRARPNFDPEPYGAVPSDDFARLAEPICTGLVRNSRAALEEEKAGYVRVRWDFKPTYDTGAPANVEMSRFHEMLFAIGEDWSCVPRPLGVGLDNLAPDLPSGLPATLRYIEPGPRARQLTLTYAVGEDLAAVTSEKLENAAMELCILHADLVLADRARYYSQLETGVVAISFVEANGKGQELERRVLFGVRDNACETGLSPMLVDAIRGMAGSDDTAKPETQGQ